MSGPPAAVCGLAIAPVKGTRLCGVEEIELEATGARGNRRFYVIDERDRMLNGKQLGELSPLVSHYDEARGWLAIELPGGSVVEGEIDLGEPVQSRFHSRTRGGRLVRGPFSEQLSRHVGRALRLVHVEDDETGVDRGKRGAVSLISRASVAQLAAQAGEPDVDARRFRMLIEIDGVGAHDEDAWVGTWVRIGEALVRFTGHAGRCVVTSRDPDSGEIDLPTLEILGDYRRGLDTTEPLAFGIYGEVLQAARIRIGDPVQPV